MLWFLFLDRFDAPGWLWGVVGSLWALYTLTWALSVWKQENHLLFTESGKRIP